MLESVKVLDFTFNIGFGKFNEKDCLKADKNSVVVYPYNSFSPVDLSSEIVGGGGVVKKLAECSKAIDGSIFCGVKTFILDIKHISVAVCNKGRLVDIVDRASNYLGDEFGTSNKIKVFSTKMGRIGLLVDSDCLLESSWQKTAEHADIMLCINRGNDEISKEEVRLFSACYKISYVYVDDNSVEWHEFSNAKH